MRSNDLVVVLPGIMGSVLAHGDRLVWAPRPGALLRAVKAFGDAAASLVLPEGLADENPRDGVRAVAVMDTVHAIPGLWAPVKGYDLLLRRLHALGFVEDTAGGVGNLLVLPYDWRLSNRCTARLLRPQIESALERLRARGGPYRDAQVVFVCHSMGGLVARWYVECEGGADITRKIVTLGTPYRGTAKALVQLVNGISPDLGRIGPELTVLARSFPSTYQLLPEYACICRGEDLVRTVDVDLPDLPTAMVADGLAFHTVLRAAESRPDRAVAVATMTHAVIGTGQPTWTTVALDTARDGGAAVPLTTYRGDRLDGDGTVALPGAVRAGTSLTSNQLRRIADRHGNLQRNVAALDELEGILVAEVVVKAPGGAGLSVSVPELLLPGSDLQVTVELCDPAEADRAAGVKVRIAHESGRDTRVLTRRPGTGRAAARFSDLVPGAYAVEVTGFGPGTPLAPVGCDVIVWDPVDRPAAGAST